MISKSNQAEPREEIHTMRRISLASLITVVFLLILACSSTSQSVRPTLGARAQAFSKSMPNVLTCEKIEAVRHEIKSRLTPEQLNQPDNELETYIKSIIGKPFQFSGVVSNVSIFGSNVDVYVDVPSCSQINVLGVAKDVAAALKKGQPVSGTGTISDKFQEGLIIHIDITEFNPQ